MPLRFLVVAAALLVSIRCSFANEKSGKANHVVVVVWDGMRPDFVTEQNTPTLAALAREGVVFKNNHSVYPSSTNVNGVVLATGCEPARNGVIANQEYRAEIDPHKPFDTSDFSALDRIDNFTSKFIATPTASRDRAGGRLSDCDRGIEASGPIDQPGWRSPDRSRATFCRSLSGQSSPGEGRSGVDHVHRLLPCSERLA